MQLFYSVITLIGFEMVHAPLFFSLVADHDRGSQFTLRYALFGRFGWGAPRPAFCLTCPEKNNDKAKLLSWVTVLRRI